MKIIPYGRQDIDDDDIRAVTEVLRSDLLTTGPAVAEFEKAVTDFCGVAHGVAMSNGTAALHAAMHALGIGPGDEVIVSPMTFAASANCVLYVGGTPVFADVEEDTLLLDPLKVEALITENTRAIIGVDFAGQPCRWDALGSLAKKHNLALVADACHALGGTMDGEKVGTLADLTVFSFHPVKHVTTGEGGMVMTRDADLAAAMRLFRSHGIAPNPHAHERPEGWFYEMRELGYNYRLTDIQAALGKSQMNKLPGYLNRRRSIARYYDSRFAGSRVRPLAVREGVEHAYHLYVVRVADRRNVYDKLRERDIYSQVHYIPVHLHPYYVRQLGTGKGLCPVAEQAYEELLSLPMFPTLTDEQAAYVADTILEFA